MGVDIDDQDIVEVALDRLFAGVAKQLGRIEFLYRNPAASIGDQIH
jgi:hypothetical protein